MTSFKPRQIVESIEVLTEPERRRRRSVQERVAIVQETLEPGATVSAVARRHGVNPNQVFAWRKQYEDGSLAAVKAGEAVCSGLITPDTNLGENTRHEEGFDEQATSYVFP
ncbi:transposase-like protein [Paraburkholderia tropica]|nr:transposase-like protein [Paraburkholderia tropica]